MRTATRKWRKVETRPPIRIDPSPSPPFFPSLEKPAAFLSGGKEEGGKKKKEKRNFQYRDSPLTLITSDSFRVCFFTYSSFSLSRIQPDRLFKSTLDFFPSVFRVFRGPLSSFSNFIAENFRQLSMLGNTILRWIYS